ncbi:DUF4003 family protein [Vallitalea pronyensis]|uniref:DUF4003 family protein n=1 Tax=Vallitalea pronyensis TaxID=1348613 RepID=A0A8J8MGF4_9FIRM|nr:DUF4003 family protein [Vallitalea pronyensis]QUI21332.1 DUF4003 family protein [Vallitalea pronyensis]
MRLENKEMIQQYLNTYHEVKSALRKEISNETIKIVALLYTISNRPFQDELFQEISARIKSKVDFSDLNGELRYILSTIIILKYDYPFTKINLLFSNLQIVDEFDLYVNHRLFIAFMLLDESNVKKRLQAASNIFYDMQDHHAFITGEEDYALSILLSGLDDSNENLMNQVEYYYKQLAKDCFKRGNALQLLSHVLTLMQLDNKDDAIKTCIFMYKRMRHEGLKVKGVMMGLFGLISAVINFNDNDAELFITEFKEIYQFMGNTKFFKKNKVYNMIIAILIMLGIHDKNQHTCYVIGQGNKQISLDYALVAAILIEGILY